jgi:hypothetical protein
MVVPADPPHDPVRHVVVGQSDLVGEESIAGLGVISVSVEDRVRLIGLLELAGGDRLVAPAVVLGSAQVEDRARHRDGDPVDGQLTDEREHHFPAGSPETDTRGSAQHLSPTSPTRSTTSRCH